MKVLIVDDDVDMRQLLERSFTGWGYEPVMAGNGNEALDILNSSDAPQIVVLDILMPGLGGLEVCRKFRSVAHSSFTYIIILTALATPDDTVAGLEAGADDYIVKPFHPEELKQRVAAGERIINIQGSLIDKVSELQHVVEHVKALQGTLPVCAYCHNIRNEQDDWKRFEEYLIEHLAVELSHGICPACVKEHFPQFEKKISLRKKKD